MHSLEICVQRLEGTSKAGVQLLWCRPFWHELNENYTTSLPILGSSVAISFHSIRQTGFIVDEATVKCCFPNSSFVRQTFRYLSFSFFSFSICFFLSPFLLFYLLYFILFATFIILFSTLFLPFLLSSFPLVIPVLLYSFSAFSLSILFFPFLLSSFHSFFLLFLPFLLYLFVSCCLSLFTTSFLHFYFIFLPFFLPFTPNIFMDEVSRYVMDIFDP